MKKFEVEVSRIDEYIIEIDETIWTEERLKVFAEVFYSFDDLEELAKHISFSLMRFGTESFHEGFGFFETYREGRNVPIKQFYNGEMVSEFCKGIKVTIVTEDDEFDYMVTEK